MDDAHVIVPQNLAVSANYDCYQCITAAIASQLVLSVEEQPGQAELLSLDAVWNDIIAFANSITAYTITQITDTLEAFQAEIVAILQEAPAVQVELSPSSSPTLSTPGSSPPSGQTTEPSPSPSPTPVEPSTGPSSQSPTEPSPQTPSASESSTGSNPSPTDSTSPVTSAETPTPSQSPSP
jgi:putative peptide zinc metalloprotease protein